MVKRYWVIKKQDGTILKDKGKILFFEKPWEAMSYVASHCGGSPYLTITEWKGKQGKLHGD